MKIGSTAKLRRRAKSVPLGVDPDGNKVRVTLVAPNLSVIDRIGEELPDPVPPLGKGVIRDRHGDPVMGPDGNPIPIRNTEHPDYLREQNRVDRMQSVATIIACLNGEVEFTARREQYPNALEYYSAVFLEMEKFGIGIGLFRVLSKEAGELIGLTADEVERAMGAFRAEEEDEEGN